MAYRQQIEWARELDLPIIIHSRDSLEDTITIIEELSRGELRGIFHCFNGDMTQAKRIVDIGFKVGLGGVITFKKVDMDGILRWLPDDAYVLETDAPYLAPTPYRGKRNESTYIPLIGEYLSLVKNYSLEMIAEITTRNAEELFRFDQFKSS
jgi:TatD DNase family protein